MALVTEQFGSGTTPVKGDTRRFLLVKMVKTAGGGGGGGGGVTAGNGAPVAAPASGAGIYIQQDSVPPGLLWEYYSGAWH